MDPALQIEANWGHNFTDNKTYQFRGLHLYHQYTDHSNLRSKI